MIHYSLKIIGINMLVVVALLTNSAFADDTCKRIEPINFYDPANDQGKVYGDLDIASYNDTIYFLANSLDRFAPELWKYNISTKERPELLTQLERGAQYFQLNIGDSVFLQLFSRGLGMVVVDLKNEHVKRYQSTLDLIFRGYYESENLLVFSSWSAQSKSFWGFDIKNGEAPYRLTGEIPDDLLKIGSYIHLLPNAIVVTGTRGDGPKETFLISRDDTPTVSAVKTADEQSISLLEYAFTINDPYFLGKTEEVGYELWKLNAEEKQLSLVTDLNPGPNSSFPFDFTLLGDDMFFLASTANQGKQLWSLHVSTSEPLIRHRHTSFPRAPKGVPSPRELVALGESLYFSVTDPSGETALWSYNPAERKPPKLEHDFDPGVLAVNEIGTNNKKTPYSNALSYVLSATAGNLFVAVEKKYRGVDFDLWMINPECRE